MRASSLGKKGIKKEGMANARVNQLTHILEELDKRDSFQKPFLWSVAFPEVFQFGGFNIVLANPPYVAMEGIDNEDERIYYASFSEVKASRADLLVYFYARALQILKHNGWLSFITSNKYMRAGYGIGLRKHLRVSVKFSRVIDFGDLPLFDANGKQVSAYPAIIIGKKLDMASDNLFEVADVTFPITTTIIKSGRKVNPENVRWVLEDLEGVLRENEVTNYPQTVLHDHHDTTWWWWSLI